jgi:hypothetical protein
VPAVVLTSRAKVSKTNMINFDTIKNEKYPQPLTLIP